MYDEFTLEYKCREESCTGFAEYALYEDSHGNHAGDVCQRCEEHNAGYVDSCVTSSRIERGLSEWWEIAEHMGWVNPIDTLFDKYGVDNPEDLPEHERQGYESAVDEAEADAIAYIEKNFSDYITQKVTVRFGEGADDDCHVETYKFFCDAEVDAFRMGIAHAVGWQSYEILYPDGELDKLRKEQGNE